METAGKGEILIQTAGLTGFKALAHAHCVLSPLPAAPQWRGSLGTGGLAGLSVGLTSLCAWLTPPGCTHTALETPGSDESQIAKYISQAFTKQRENRREQIT